VAPSAALQELQNGIAEFRALRSHPPMRRPQYSASAHSTALVAHRRACTVLLSGFYENYFYGVDEIAVSYLNGCGIDCDAVPVKMRLVQARKHVDDMSRRSWEKRQADLELFAQQVGPMWMAGETMSTLRAGPNLESMKAPTTQEVRRLYRLYGVEDVFSAVTRTSTARGKIIRSLDTLVENRNGIAHGDQTVQPTRTELTQYVDAVEKFCTRADVYFRTHLQRMSKTAPAPW
jgi:hypothetical protein